MKKALYQWQEECLRRWRENGRRGMVQAATGSGKTFLALEAIERADKERNGSLRIKIVVPTGGLMRQWYGALREFLSEREEDSISLRKKIGLRGGGRKDPEDRKYMIYVINSARYELARRILSELQRGETVFLIADECHRYESGQNRLIFEFLPFIKPYEERFFSLGLSATLPGGAGESYLASVLGKRIYSYEMKRAAALRTVCQYDIYHISLSFREEERFEYEDITERMRLLYRKLLGWFPSLGEVNQRERFEMLRALTGDRNRNAAEAAAHYMKLAYKRKSLVCLASARCLCAYDLIKKLGSEEKIIIFGERISQAEELYGLLEKSYPGRVGRYHSGIGQQANQNTMERFRNGELRILIACKAVDEGIDVPDASVGIILSGTSTQRQRIQRLGRIVRQKEGKGCAALYYLHITDTSEDLCFLPEAGSRIVFELEYLPDAHEFVNPPYDKAADAVLREMRRKGAGEEELMEAGRCLELGSVRSDWRLAPASMAARIREARYVEDKNYWICMKRLANLPQTGKRLQQSFFPIK